MSAPPPRPHPAGDGLVHAGHVIDGDAAAAADDLYAALHPAPAALGERGFSMAGADFLFAFGRVKLVTRQNFTATRRGDTIFVKGTVTHLWHEPYDFDRSTDSPDSGLLTGAAIVAKEGGRAREFAIRSGWVQNVEGTVTIKNGTLSNPQLRWSDSDAVVNWNSEENKNDFPWPTR